ncbi:MAG: YheC/YheD family protein [Thermaerobacterales bacterium]
MTTKRAQPAAPFGLDTPLIAGMCLLGAGRGMVVYGFTPGDIQWRKNIVRGFQYQGAGGWIRRSMPFPEAVYDRLPSRRTERRRVVRRTKRRLLRVLGDRYFNREFFDKWRVHKLLADDPDYGFMLPVTALYRGRAQLRRWLARYRMVWIKPRDGTQGRGITVIRRAAGGYHVYRRRDEQWFRRKVGSLKMAARLVRRQGGRRRYLVQQGLNLSRYGGRPFDLRILLQKNRQGAWTRTKTIARVAARGSVTSNISTGGLGRSFSRVAAKASGAVSRQPEELTAKIHALALGLARRIEERLGYLLGEVALDLGIDVRGNVWFIEANSKPFRTTSARKNLQSTVRKSLLRPLLYAEYVTSRSGYGPDRKNGTGGLISGLQAQEDRR